MNTKTTLAQALISLGYIDETRLNELQITFDELAPNTPLDAQLLIASEIEEKRLLEVMQKAYGIPVLTLGAHSEDTSQLTLIFPPDLAQSHQLVPFELNSEGLTVLLSRPLPYKSIQKIQHRTKLKLHFLLTTSIQIAQLLHKLYGIPLPVFALDELSLAQTTSARIKNSASNSSRQHRGSQQKTSEVNLEVSEKTPSTTSPESKSTLIPVPSNEALLDNLESPDSQTQQQALHQLLQLGSDLDDLIRKRFPGQIASNPLTSEGELPELNQCSPLLRYLQARGPSACNVVLPHLDNANPIARFFAVYFFQAVYTPQSLKAMSRRLYDSEPKIRTMTTQALREYAEHDTYTQIVDGLLQKLKIPLHHIQISAIGVLGQLRERKAIPSLISLLMHPNPTTKLAAKSALTIICGQEIGVDVIKWRNWWQQHKPAARTQWLTMGLQESNEQVQKLAADELRRIPQKQDSRDVPPPIVNNQNSIVHYKKETQIAGVTSTKGTKE